MFRRSSATHSQHIPTTQSGLHKASTSSIPRTKSPHVPDGSSASAFQKQADRMHFVRAAFSSDVAQKSKRLLEMLTASIGLRIEAEAYPIKSEKAAQVRDGLFVYGSLL